MKDDFFRQCVLKSENFETVAWIPERGAKVGYQVTLKDSDEPLRLWTVLSASSMRLPMQEALEKAREAIEFKRRGSIAAN
jgi:hypothetical protein